MPVAIIAAMSRNRVIGHHGAIPWHLPEDLRRFRELTTGQTVVMGRKTFESIGKPLPGRTTIIISRDCSYAAMGCRVARSLEEALSMGSSNMVFICGGGEIYRKSLEIADVIYLTVIDVEIEGDTFFPEMPPYFAEVSREPLSASPAADFVIYRRIISVNPGAPL